MQSDCNKNQLDRTKINCESIMFSFCTPYAAKFFQKQNVLKGSCREKMRFCFEFSCLFVYLFNPSNSGLYIFRLHSESK